MICVDCLQITEPESKLASKSGDNWYYLFSDDGNPENKELHQIAFKISLKGNSFQNHTFLPHYDLTRDQWELALKNGAIEKESASTVREAMLKSKRNRLTT